MIYIYSYIIYPLLLLAAYLLAPFNKKTQQTLRLRSVWRAAVAECRPRVTLKSVVWVHVASAGELEYALPIIEACRQQSIGVVLTYYSVSAVQSARSVFSQYTHVLLVSPLPHDGFGIPRNFVQKLVSLNIKKLILAKYDFWPGLLSEVKKAQISVVVVDAVPPRRWTWVEKYLWSYVDAVDFGYGKIESQFQKLVGSIGGARFSTAVSGDTRVEQVVKRLAQPSAVVDVVAQLKARFSKSESFVLGSMWPEDVDVFLSTAELGISAFQNIFWVPHEIEDVDSAHYQKQFKLFEEKQNYKVSVVRNLDGLRALSSTLARNATPQRNVFVIAMKGVLAPLYQVAWGAFVGGSVQKNTHSVIEPLLAGCQVIIGPKRERSPETYVLEELGLLTVAPSVDAATWNAALQKLRHDYGKYAHDSDAAERRALVLDQFRADHRGASSRIVERYCRGDGLSVYQQS